MTSTAKPDYWSLLGLNPNSDIGQIKRAFRREARKWHPDLNSNDRDAEERFKLINEAYAVLSDPAKRQLWERNDSVNFSTNDPFVHGFPSYEEYISLVLGIDSENDSEEYGEHIDQDYYSYESEEILEDNLNEEQPQSNQWPARSANSPPPVQALDDIETLVDLSVEEALNGAEIDITLTDGTIVQISTPPFAGHGWRLRLPGIALGNKDHFIQLRVQTDEGLRIDGLRVLYRLELLPPEALLGCAVQVPTLSGNVTLQVPPRSSSGRLLRLRGRGLEFDTIKGDQFVEIVVVIPEEVSEAEFALYRRLQDLANEEH